MQKASQNLIQALQLLPHPEGGYYKEVYRAKDIVTTTKNKRSASTSIYFLLEKNDFSAWHRITADEIWHFYSGTSLTIYVIDENGELKTFKLGNPIEESDAEFQVIIHANQWFAAEVNDKSSYTLVGCTVAPGFEFEDFELADRKVLVQQYPVHEKIINKLTR